MPIFNEFVVSFAPGASGGYCQVLSPGLDKGHLRNAKLAASVVAAIKAGTLTINNGTMLAIDKAAPNAGYKVAGTANDATHVLAASWDGGAYPSLLNSFAPSLQSAGSSSIYNFPNSEYETDNVGATTSMAPGRFVTVDVNGKLVDGGTSRVAGSVGKLISIDPNVVSQADQSVFVTKVVVLLFGSGTGL